MKNHLFTLGLLLLASALPNVVSASVVFEEDFQTGQYNDWQLSGLGSDSANDYFGNVSLRLDGLRTAEMHLSTSGYQQVQLSMDLAALYLIPGDFCHAEYSVNGGQSWQTVVTLGAGQANGNFTTGGIASGLDNQQDLRLRFRAYTLYGNYCYGDNVLLSGVTEPGSILLQEDFQSGSYPAWSMSGLGSDQINLYAGNYSMRLDGLRQGVLEVSTEGYQQVRLSMDLAALYLVSGDVCHAEYSTDQGQSWNSLLTLGHTQADGNFRSQSVQQGLDDRQLLLRYRAYTLYGHYCYGDNVELTGTPIDTTPLPQLNFSGQTQFTDTQTGQSSVQSYTISNTGSATLELQQISLTGEAFSLTEDSCSSQSLIPTASCQFTVDFTPNTADLFQATLSVPSNAPDTPFSSQLSGVGIVDNGDPNCDYDCLDGNGQVNRSALGYTQLMSTAQGQLVNYSHYAVPTQAANPEHQFSGTLSLTITTGVFSEQGTNLASAYTSPDTLPAFEFEFVQKGTHFLPVQRQLIQSGHPSWDYILLPGQVWQEAGDQGYSRVALPFALQEVNANCIHNGVMTFLFKEDGSVSNLAYQIAQETCQYFKFNLHGKLTASYQPHAIADEASIVQSYLQEQAQRIPQKSLTELASDYPAANLNLATIGSE
ncbi:MAG: choice-of-anchor D domain-containing protein, partial [Alkalimonas sp.]|nr:choice-of-anchor D domain-containing protein [Alkalimonas sp.]